VDYRFNAFEARQCDIAAQDSAIEAELSELRESANRMEHELSEMVTDIGTVSFAAAVSRRTLSRRTDKIDERLIHNERCGLGLLVEVEAFQGTVMTCMRRSHLIRMTFQRSKEPEVAQCQSRPAASDISSRTEPYDRLSISDARRGFSPEAFQILWRDNPDDMLCTNHLLRSAFTVGVST
jgi:hypothetical protein